MRVQMLCTNFEMLLLLQLALGFVVVVVQS